MSLLKNGFLTIVLLAALAPAALPQEEPLMASLLTHPQDLQATLLITERNDQALEKIGSDFARNYSLRSLTLLYKSPGMMRLDGRSAAFGDATLIYNGAVRFYAVPKLHLHRAEDLSAHPGLRQSLLEYMGLITPETLRFMQADSLGVRALKAGESLPFYSLTYKGEKGGSYYRIWVDPATRLTVCREWYGPDNRLKARFNYLAPKLAAPDLWVPTVIEVRNAEGVLAARTEVEEVEVKKDLNKALFTTGT